VRLRKAFRAASAALVLGLLWPAAAGAKPGKTQPKHRKHSRHPAVASGSAARSGGGRLLARPKGPEWKASPGGRRAKANRRIRQDESGRVVLASASPTSSAPVYGPFLPVEAFDQPPAPCPPVDVAIEARLHDENPDADEAQASDESSEEADGAAASAPEERLLSADRLFSVARRIGSLLRPKSAKARVTPADVDLGELLSANLRIPVEGVDAERLRDSFLEGRGRYRKHLAIDIGAPRGTSVIATSDGEIVRLRREKRGGISIYQKDPTGKYLFFYCHLSRYARGLAVGQKVSAGDVIGYVGATGHVIGGPHLHFSITRVPEDDDFREGLAVNPYLLFLAGVP
jgi:hypothetical protein